VIDEDEVLRRRFAELRAEERVGMPRFNPRPARSSGVAWRVIAATAALLLALVAIVTWSRPTRFSGSDRAVIRSVAEWHAPTDFLLRTPGSEMLTTTPRIPDLKGIQR
jgi:hypothetical protein